LIASSTQRHRKSIGVRVASIADHSTSSIRLRARATVASMISRTSSSLLRIWCARWIGDVDTKVWMRPRLASFTASPARSISALMARASPAMIAPSERLGDFADGFKVAVGGNGKTCFDDVDAHLFQQFGDLKLFFKRHGRAGRLFAITQCGVENADIVAVRRVNGGRGSWPGLLVRLGVQAQSFKSGLVAFEIP
jgi:hypothetical protein